MPTNPTGQEIVDHLTKKLGSAPKSVVFDVECNPAKLSIYEFVLPQMPPEI